MSNSFIKSESSHAQPEMADVIDQWSPDNHGSNPNSNPHILSPNTENLNSTDSKSKFKRNYRACLNCRLRKVKCDLGSVDNPRDGKCARCLRERRDCTFVKSKRGGSSNVINGKRKRQTASGSGSGSTSPSGLSDEQRQLPQLQTSPDFTSSRKTNIPVTLPPVHRIMNENKKNSRFGSTQSQYEPPAFNTGALPSLNRISSVGDTYADDRTISSGSSRGDNDTSARGANFTQARAHPDQKLISRAYALGEHNRLDNYQGTNNSNPAGDSNGGNHFSTMEGALVFLAKAAGTIAKADERDHIDAREKHEQLEAKSRNHSGPPSVSNDGSNLMERGEGSLISSNTPTPGAYTLGNEQQSSSSSRPPVSIASSIPSYINKSHIKNKRMFMPPAESGEMVRPRATTRLSDIEYIGGPDSILSEVEAENLINLFFTTMHPYFPHLPKFLHSPKVLPGYPILLCAILTIAARYQPFEDNSSTSEGPNNVPRNIEVHDRLWLYVQRLISQTVWAEASTRSIGTVFAFLLFTEWNPRAIHWRWDDYANEAEDNTIQAGAGPSDEPTGLGAMRRSYRMSWMLIGSAVRLAQDIGFMEISSKTFIATHIAEINSAMNISRRSMLSSSLSEVDLDEEEITEEDMEQGEDNDSEILSMSEEELRKLSSERVLRFTQTQKAKIELLQIISLGHEALYGNKAQLGTLSQRQNLSVLNIISPLINNWGRRYKCLLKSSSSKILKNVSNLKSHLVNPNSKVSKDISSAIEYECFIFEFNYTKLYIYSLALSHSPKNLTGVKHKKMNLKLDELSKSAKYIEQAFSAANEMLSVTHRVHKLKMLRFMPIRWLTRIVKAVAFIVKCYLTITAHKSTSTREHDSHASASSFDNFDSTVLSLSLISIDEIVQSIQRAAITLRDCSPDELHLCSRYSNVLMYLCSEMKTKAKHANDEESDHFHSNDRCKRQKKNNRREAEDDFDSNNNRENNWMNHETSQSVADFNNKPKEKLQSTTDITMSHVQQGQEQNENFATSQELRNSSFMAPADDTQATQGSSQTISNNLNFRPTISSQTQFDFNSLAPSMKPTEANHLDGNPEPLAQSFSNSNIGTPIPTPSVGDSEVMEWFVKNRNIGLDFVGPWTEMIEQQLNSDVQFNFDDAIS